MKQEYALKEYVSENNYGKIINGSSSEILTNCNLTGDEAEAKIVALFGITLGMGTTCLIPVSFAVLGCSAYENFHNDLSYKKSLLEGCLH